MIDMWRAQRALPKYFRILNGEELPNFHYLKRIKVDFEEDEDISELWKLHDEALELLKRGKLNTMGKYTLLDLKLLIARKMLKSCILCEFKCRLNRERSIGYCRVKNTKIVSYFMHMGEEPELVPSFTIFFSGCNFRCVFCQNWDISQRTQGIYIQPRKMARIIDDAFERGAKNVNLVGGEPTPNIPYILEVLNHVTSPIPVVWNSNMYMSEEAMKLLDGMVDIYLGDFKWADDKKARKYSKALHYRKVVTRNFLLAKEHYRVEFLIRHLVMPGFVEDTRKILSWISTHLGKNVRVNVMFQYYPCYRASEYPEINRRLSYNERKEVERIVQEIGLENALVG